MIFDYKSNATVKKKMLEEGVEYVCHICGLLPEWEGQDLTLQLDHIDGNKNNTHINNLRFVCPNCHTQTDTWGGKNRGKYDKSTKKKRDNCTCGLFKPCDKTTKKCIPDWFLGL